MMYSMKFSSGRSASIPAGATIRFPRAWIAAALILAAALAVAGQDRPPCFTRFDVEDGLSQGSVMSIVQDRRGFIWIGTLDGLNRFDGIEFRTYRHDPADPSSLSSSTIGPMLVDGDGMLWIGTAVGLDRYDPARDGFVRHRIPFGGAQTHRSAPVSAIAETRDGTGRRLWVAAGNLFFLDDALDSLVASTAMEAQSDSFPDRSVATLHADRDAYLWVGSYTWLFRFDPRTGGIDHVQRFAGSGHAVSVTGHEGTYLVGTPRGVFTYDIGTRRSELISRSVPKTFLEDRSGRLWIGTDAGLELIERVDGGVRRRVLFRHDEASPEGLSNNVVTDLYEDASGAVWIGTLDGLNRVDDYTPRFEIYRSRLGGSDGLGYDFVLPIMEDRDGGIWLGTLGDGIWVLPDGATKWNHYGGSPGTRGMCGGNIRSLMQDRTGRVWAGTDGGLAIHDPASARFTCIPIRKSDSQNPSWVEALCESRDGVIWLGANNVGLIGFDPRLGRLDSLQQSRVIPLEGDTTQGNSVMFNTLIEDRSGNLWAGTEFGLVGIDPATGSYVRYTHDAGDSATISHNSVWAILEDSSDTPHVLWVGTSDGLNRFDVRNGSFRRYDAQEGFPSSFVYAIVRDDSGRLWLSTNHGLTRFDDRMPAGRKFRNFDVADGLPGNEFNRRSACRLRNGEILFGGTRGVVRFNPIGVRDNPHPPRVIITSFQKFGKRVLFDRDVSEVEQIELRHYEDVFSFEFTALSFPQASKNLYRYKLEGFDRDWSPPGTRRFAGYTHLDPGEYVFRVRGANNDGVWNEAGASVRLIIHPPYWQAWWFRSLAFVLVAGVAAGFYRYRVSRLRQAERLQRRFSAQLIASQEQERSRIAGELHDDLMQSLLVAKNRALMGLRKSGDRPSVERELKEIEEAMTHAVDEVRGIAHKLRPYQVDRLGLTRSLQSLVGELNEATTTTFGLAAESIDAEFTAEESILVYRIIQEATNNILKHSGGANASIAVTRSAGSVSLRIVDDGKGFATGGMTNAGFGLRGIAERVRMLNGSLVIDSAPGRGTTLSIVIPRRHR